VLTRPIHCRTAKEKTPIDKNALWKLVGYDSADQFQIPPEITLEVRREQPVACVAVAHSLTEPLAPVASISAARGATPIRPSLLEAAPPSADQIAESNASDALDILTPHCLVASRM